MEKFDIYKDIAKRSGGDLYIGVVGPVRTGKSTFVSRFSELIITPNIQSKNKKLIAVDELPVSSSGKTVTTVEPKFVPSEAVKIAIKGKGSVSVRLIDCVGFMVDGAIGGDENGEERLLKTPWEQEPMPFSKAAELGTKKVILDHSTIAVMVTTDGTIADIKRENYIKAEEKTISELKKANKPFVIALNSADPNSVECKEIADSMQEKYGASVVRVNLLTATAEDLTSVIEKVLYEFPIRLIDIALPKWLQVLPSDSKVILEVIKAVKEIAPSTEKMKHGHLLGEAVSVVDGIKSVNEKTTKLGEGKIVYSVEPDKNLYYQILSELSSVEITDELALAKYIKELTIAKDNYEKLKSALSEVEENGYGVAIPSDSEMILKEPEVIKTGGRYGVKLKAGSSCMHLIKINLDASVTPIYGTKKQCEDYAEFIKEEYNIDKNKVWNTTVFGKPLSSLIQNEIARKIYSMKDETKTKMKKTVNKIVNDGKGGILCILI